MYEAASREEQKNPRSDVRRNLAAAIEFARFADKAAKSKKANTSNSPTPTMKNALQTMSEALKKAAKASNAAKNGGSRRTKKKKSVKRRKNKTRR